ncbi:precorrin-3B synthase [Cypionkella aquatica]|uniref:Precorrin-3B synthase n=1 Tax=Cypionkella aquatica TaxID=1756042 RepID=A0AA37U335_9RHOB|nr:precorrin-3B synthase [Cypionkella aquatica]GLS86529.1 precorrin-3B synthase [Cypionkella aquatica]
MTQAQTPAINGPVSQAPIIQGWCPGALRPMQSGDGLVVRIRPRASRLTPDQARGIARLAALHGNGLIDLSNRANVQLRGVTDASHPALIDGLRALDLIDADAADEARRNIITTPFWQDADSTQPLAEALALALTAPDAPQLPSKFGFALDTAATPCLRDAPADIWLETGAQGLLLSSHADLALPVTRETAVAEAVALAHWFITNGGVSDGRGRMAALLKRIPLPSRFASRRLPAAAKPGPGPTPQGQLVALEFGQMQAETLLQLADLGPLRITPWRMLLIEGVSDAPHLPGLITRADDPMLRVIACTGAPGCLQAHAATRDLARALAPSLRETLHVSGCAKGCAHPGPAPLTLTATPTGFALIRDGTASGTPAREGLSASDLTETLFRELP